MKNKEKNMLFTKEIGELKKELGEKKEELTRLLVEMYGGKEKNLKKAKNLRREIAQILTIVKEKEFVGK